MLIAPSRASDSRISALLLSSFAAAVAAAAADSSTATISTAAPGVRCTLLEFNGFKGNGDGDWAYDGADDCD